MIIVVRVTMSKGKGLLLLRGDMGYRGGEGYIRD